RRPGVNFKHWDEIVFGVGEINVAVRRDAHAFRTGKRCLKRRTAIAGETLLPRAGNSMDDTRRHSKIVDGISFAQREDESATAIEVKRARTVERHFITKHKFPLRGRLSFTVASKGRDVAGFHVHLADAMIPDVANVEVAFGIKTDAVRFTELRFHCGSAVAAETRDTSASNRRDDTAFRIDAAHEMIKAFDEEHVARGVEAHLIWFIQCGARGGAAI